MSDEGEHEGDCGKCGKEVKQGDNALECDVCHKWHHITCVNVKVPLYKALKNYNESGTGMKWFCGQCEGAVCKLLGNIAAVFERQDKFEADIVEIRKDLQVLKDGAQCIKASFADKLKVGVLQDGGQCSSNAGSNVEERHKDREFQAQINEAMERDKRKKNLVLMGVPEDVKDEGLTAFIEGMFGVMVEGDRAVFDVQGRIGVMGDRVRVRPIRISLETERVKGAILKGAKSLKDRKEYEKIYVVPDLTRNQQHDDKILRDKLKTYRRDGVVGIKIVRGSIVREVDGQKEVLFTNSN